MKVTAVLFLKVIIIEKLRKFQLKAVLISKDLHDVTSGIVAKSDKAYADSLKNYILKVTKAQESLIAWLEPGSVPHIIIVWKFTWNIE